MNACPSSDAPLSFVDDSARVSMPVVVLVADGARPDAFAGELRDFPALRTLRQEGGVHEVTTVFPSVTGPAYTPFLLGRFPGGVGIPGLRWYDRAHEVCGWPDYARSYVGYQMGRIDTDLDRSAPTVFELVPKSIGAFSVITRGLTRRRRIGTITPRSAARAAYTHFGGLAERWLDIDRELGDVLVERMERERPDYVFAALTGIDKASHARGHGDALTLEALGIVDSVAGRLRAQAERGGWWSETHLWIVSDHGHAHVHTHDDLAGAVRDAGFRTMAHPWSFAVAPEVAVMVSGNAMAHVYVELTSRTRQGWHRLAERWDTLVGELLGRASMDLVLLPHSAEQCEVRNASRGTAFVERRNGRYAYRRVHGGDPLSLGRDIEGDADETHEATFGSAYPDALVQIIALAAAPRSGDIILSATPGFDFRDRYEPIPHRSAHGALHRDHTLVPLLTNRPPARRPRRTTDVFASTLAALGIALPAVIEGFSFL